MALISALKICKRERDNLGATGDLSNSGGCLPSQKRLSPERSLPELPPKRRFLQLGLGGQNDSMFASREILQRQADKLPFILST